jgi:hypothetical protein
MNEDDPDRHQQASDDFEPLLREHLEWAMARIEISSGSGTY